MSDIILFYVVMGATVLALTLLHLLTRPKKSAPAKLEPPRWHKWFDDPV